MPQSIRLIAAMRGALCAICLATSCVAPALGCALETIGQGVVEHAIDGRSFRLTDGRDIRLAGIEAPLVTRSKLDSLLAGREVTLRGAKRETDRYGRLVAYALMDGVPVQHLLLARGQAQVASQADPCRADLLAEEAKGRSAGLGLWADTALGAQNATDSSQILARRGHFAVVEGKVLSVRSSGSTTYMNFGQRWIEGFAVTIRKRDERAFAAAGLTPKSLEGKRVRVRGYVDERGGPRIEASLPEQIEVVDVK